MDQQFNDAVNQRGGIAVRDYTRDSPAATASRALVDRRSARGGLARYNFEKVARGLGWLGLGLGVYAVLRPRRVQKLVGLRRHQAPLVRALGVRELFHTALIFVQPRAGAWSRVSGDALQLAVLGSALANRPARRGRLVVTTVSLVGLSALDLLTATQLGRHRPAEPAKPGFSARQDGEFPLPRRSFYVSRSITINRSPETLYEFWRNFENLPDFMLNLESVEVEADGRSHWVARAPAGRRIAWDAELTEDRHAELIAWRSLPGTSVPNAGRVRFQRGPAGRGTVVRVELEYRLPGGRLGKAIAQLFGEEPGQQVAEDLRRFKQVMELGAIVRSEGSPRGYGQKRERPARPLPRANGERRESEMAESERAAAQPTI